jgi:hypothetical protein
VVQILKSVGQHMDILLPTSVVLMRLSETGPKNQKGQLETGHTRHTTRADMMLQAE